MSVFLFEPSPYKDSDEGSINTVPALKEVDKYLPVSLSYISTSASKSKQHPKTSRSLDK